MVIRYLTAIFTPAIMLVFITLLACVAAYVVVSITGDADALRKLIIRFSQLFLLLSIFPFMKIFGWHKADLGFADRALFLRQLKQGFLLGLLTLLPVFVILKMLGVSVFDSDRPWTVFFTLKRIALSLLLAALIGVIEESIFRGLLFSSLKTKVSSIAAVIISAVYFAGLHFLDNKTPGSGQEVDFFTGFVLLKQAYANVFDSKNLPAFFALFMVGVFLAVIRADFKQGLGLCIGCHAGWVWLIKMNNLVFNTNYQSDYLYLVSPFDYVVGPMVAVWLLLALTLYFLGVRKLIRTTDMVERAR